MPREGELYAAEGPAPSLPDHRGQCGPSSDCKRNEEEGGTGGCLSLFPAVRPGGHPEKYPAQLSGGMRQRAALLRTYLFSGSVALLDEPFSALDMLTKKSVHDWYLKVMDEIHLSTLFITHDIDEAILLSDRIYLLTGRPGRITEELIIKETKPRDRDFGLTEEFLEYKRHILRHLETTV